MILERSFYEKECTKEAWDVRTLRQEMDSALFLRVAASKDKEGITCQKPKDIIKSTYTLHFLNIPQQGHHSNSIGAGKVMADKVENITIHYKIWIKAWKYIGGKKV